MADEMITLNNRPYSYTRGLTIASLMRENNFEFSHIIAKINGAVIEDEKWHETKISAGDNVEIIHIFGGG